MGTRRTTAAGTRGASAAWVWWDARRAHRKGPEALRRRQRERLAATLLCWLEHHGQRAAMAAELNIHEQTVGYRVNQLREVFGDCLNDPRSRFQLELVLRAGFR